MKTISLYGLMLLLLLRDIIAAPVNDNFADAETLTGISATRLTSTVGATAEENEPEHDFRPTHASVWYRWTTSETGFATITTAGSDFDTILAVYVGTALSGLTRVVSNDDAGNATSKVNFVTDGGTTYFIAIDGYEGASGNLKLTLNLLTGLQAPLNDNYASATFLTNAPISLIASNYLATLESGELTPVTNGGSSLWWLWEAPATGYFIVSTVGSDFDTILSVYKNGTLVTWDDDAARPASVVRFYARAGARYHLSVQGYRAAMGVIHLSVTLDPPKPAPPWALLDMTDQTRHSSDFIGKVVMLDLWATWCGPCVEEVPSLIALQEKYGPDGLVVIGVSTDQEGFQVVAPFADSHGVNYLETVLNNDFARDYGPVEFIPLTYIFNREGMIVDKFVGLSSQDTLENAILPLLFPDITVQATREGDEMVLRWPAASTGYIVQATATLIPANWTTLFIAISVSGETNVARIPISGVNRYFRLMHN